MQPTLNRARHQMCNIALHTSNVDFSSVIGKKCIYISKINLDRLSSLPMMENDNLCTKTFRRMRNAKKR